jgi:alkylation response protein AidB-like acyl-CoA dehydrogenase
MTTAVSLLADAADVAADWATRAERHDREASFAHENIQSAWAAGLGNLSLYADLRTTTRAVRTLGAGDPSSALVLVMHLIALKAATVPGSEWTDAAREAVLDSSHQGPALANHLRVEPDLGTPARGGVPAARAVATGDGWRVSGHKLYSTGSVGLRWLVVWAATAEPEPRVGHFLVPADAPGVEIRPTWDHLGMRASASHDVILHDVEIPHDHAFALALALATAGPPVTPGPLLATWMTSLVVSVYLGVADAARDWLVGWLQERAPANLGAPLATLPRFQSAVGEIEARLFTAGALLDGVAAAADRGEPDARATALAKLVGTREAIGAVQDAVALTGNPGLTRGHPLERHLRDVLCARIHTPQDDSILLNVGRAALTIDPRS